MIVTHIIIKMKITVIFWRLKIHIQKYSLAFILESFNLSFCNSNQQTCYYILLLFRHLLGDCHRPSGPFSKMKEDRQAEIVSTKMYI